MGELVQQRQSTLQQSWST
ncbi:unnamed protein product [Linum tenue]|uniref:Uncharacterized protein n=1 Tax=Linum tenue TaxID=586396 RepID=A0AAV0JYB0_9ROSI|nr:unnamed protein product [Linum tenue]CAI0416794.1 unnamed protein product [Linum tenue]